MSTPHKATPVQWKTVEGYAAENFEACSCILELRARVEALEAAQQPPQDKLDRLIALDAADSLVDRVAAVAGKDRKDARAAIREVAAWLRTERQLPMTADMLEREASR